MTLCATPPPVDPLPMPPLPPAAAARLAEFLARHRGPVALSNQATERIVELYDRLGFTLSFLQGPRRISCKERKPALEVLATRNL